MTSRTKRATEHHEGAEAAWRFEHALRGIVQVSREELEQREAAYQESRKSKSRPGPKPSKK